MAHVLCGLLLNRALPPQKKKKKKKKIIRCAQNVALEATLIKHNGGIQQMTDLALRMNLDT